MNSTSDTVEIVIIFFRLFSCIQCASSRPSVTCVAINTDTISMPNSDKNIRRLKSSPDTSATTGMELFNGASGMADFFNTLFWLPQALFPLLPSTPSQPNLYSAPQYPGLRYPTTNNTHLHSSPVPPANFYQNAQNTYIPSQNVQWYPTQGYSLRPHFSHISQPTLIEDDVYCHTHKYRICNQ